jgi:hypothetical protein
MNGQPQVDGFDYVGRDHGLPHSVRQDGDTV